MLEDDITMTALAHMSGIPLEVWVVRGVRMAKVLRLCGGADETREMAPSPENAPVTNVADVNAIPMLLP